jgi:outer membrane protein assembly factor BamB
MRLLAICGLAAARLAQAQFGGGAGDFATSGGDAQRSSWIRSDAKISRETVQKPGFQYLWKIKLDNEPKQGTSLSEAALLTRYIGYRGFRSLGFTGGSADKVFAMDTDLGRLEWQKTLASSASPCGMTSNLARPVSAAFPAGFGGRGGGGGRGGPAKSGVGEPGEGSVILKEIAARAGGDNPGGGRRAGNNTGRGAPGAPGAPGFPGGGGRIRMPNYVHAVSSDGMFHSMYVSNGEEPEPPVRFVPANAGVLGLIVVDNVAYAVTGGNCGGANAVWALDIATKQVTNWQSTGGAVTGHAGVAMGPDGTLYLATANGELAALEPKTLKLKDVYKAGVGFSSSPVVLQKGDGALIAVAAKDGQIHLLDAAKLGGAVAKSAASGGAPDALATWQDAAGTRYLLAAGTTSIIALKVTDGAGAPAIENAWTREMSAPLTPLVINGVVFTGSRGSRSSPAVLYALDGSTGNPLWNSAKTITSYISSGGISGGGSQVYLGTHDATIYAFGFPIEH